MMNNQNKKDNHKTRLGMKKILLSLAGFGSLVASGTASAIGSDSDGWITPQLGHPMFITYMSHNSSSELYADGEQVSDNANLDANVAVLRYVHPVDVGNDIIMTPNVLLPLVNIETTGDTAALGDTSGMGDLMLVSGLWLVHDWAERKHFAVVPFVWLPTGDYDKDKPLNLGENRYKFAVQVGGQLPVGDRWDFSGSIDTTWFGENSDAELKQKPETQIDGWLKYNMQSTEYSHVAVGLSHIMGSETEVAGVAQDNEKKTTSLKVQFGTLIDDSNTRHALFTVARDLEVENGLKTDVHIEMRLTQVF